MMSGIYYIFNFATSKIYVGSSRDLEKRLRTHEMALKRNGHQNVFLQRAWNIHKAFFDFGVLEQCATENLLNREAFYIGVFEARNPANGYNLQWAARDDSSERWNPSVRAVMSNNRKRYLNSNPEVKKAQIDRLQGFWMNTPERGREAMRKRSKVRSFRNEITGEVFVGTISDLRRKYPSSNLDKAALMRVSSGVNRMCKNWVKC